MVKNVVKVNLLICICYNGSIWPDCRQSGSTSGGSTSSTPSPYYLVHLSSSPSGSGNSSSSSSSE